MCSRNGAVTYSEAENSAGDKESGATMPKPQNLVGRAKRERCSVPGGSRPFQAGMNFVNSAFSSLWKKMKCQELYVKHTTTY